MPQQDALTFQVQEGVMACEALQLDCLPALACTCGDVTTGLTLRCDEIKRCSEP